MNPIQKQMVTTVLAGACLAMAAFVALEYQWLKHSDPNIQPPAPATPAATPENQPKASASEPPPSLDQFETMVSRPLFVEGRKPLADTESTDETPVSNSPPPEIQLTGIIETPDAGQIVLVRGKDGKTKKIKPGDEIDGWKLSELAPDHVILQQGGKEHTLQLIKPRPVALFRRPRPRPKPRPKSIKAPVTNPFQPPSAQQ